MLKLSFFGPPSYHRMEGGVSKPWYDLYSNENCTVVGDDTNRSYRYPNGMQIVQMRYAVTATIGNAWGVLYETADITPPNYVQGFAAAPSVTVQASANTGAYCMIEVGGGATNARGPVFNLVRPNTAVSQSYWINITAIGRWF